MAEEISLSSKYDLKENYNPSDSEDEYTPNEKRLLAKARQNRHADSSSEEEVYAFSDSDNEEADIADSDVEGQEASEDDLPDIKAWGQKKKLFYNTDYVDEDYGGFGKDEEVANLEEHEARILQKRLAEQLGDEDFSLEFFPSKKTSEENLKDNDAEILIKTDLSQMSKRQKLQFLKKESPEFSGLIEDFKEKALIAKDHLHPLMKLIKSRKLPDCTAVRFIQTYYETILNYLTNISFYLLLKSKKISIQNHPVTKRLFQYRQTLKQLEPLYEESIKTQVERILAAIENNEDISILSKNSKKRQKKQSSSNSKKLKLLSDKNGDEDQELDNSEEENDLLSDEMEENNVPSMITANETNINDMEGGEKRAITYQMAKNKGLTPRRKKEQRNPRVKHRNKYRKAKIRRKGAIREVRTEMVRYGGEMSGIKANVKKSIKIK